MKKRNVNRITKLDDDLNGVFFSKGKKYVIKGALKNELIEYTEKAVSGNTVICEADNVLEKSESRINPACPYANECGGCDLLHMPYSEQLKIKFALVKRKFSNYCNNIEEIVPSELKERNKIHIAFSVDGGKVILGFFNENTHKVIDIENCLLHSFYDRLRASLLCWIKKEKVSLYNPKKRNGILRFALVRVLDNSIQITLVVTKKDTLKYDTLYNLLLKSFKSVSLYECENNLLTNQVMSDNIRLKMGDKYLNGACADVSFSLTPKAFFQTNSEIAEKIYRKIIEFVKESDINDPLILDLFSGIGITSILFAKEGFRVTSMEIVTDAVQEAKRMAERNGVADKLNIFEGDATKLTMPVDGDKAIVFVDPPRGGLKALTEILLSKSPRNIIYLSCNLRSAIADIALLSSKYRVNKVIPFDMFPYTKYVECLVSLEREK